MKKQIIIIAGATACGKTNASIKIAKKINGEIISVDSMQVYKYMDIGTAKIKHSQMNGIKHYLIDEFYPNDDFSVAIFKEYAKKYINEIYLKGKIPILVGGTGFYINAILYDNEFVTSKKDDNYRKYLTEIANTKGNLFLHTMLEKIDFVSANNIHHNNVKKIIRAIEYFKLNSETISEHNKKEKQRQKAYDETFFVLNMERQKLYERINIRVDMMLDEGLVGEVTKLLNMGYKKDSIAMQGIGYKEIIKYIDGVYSLDDAIEDIKKGTRHFAKRQITWFKHQVNNAFWIDTQNEDAILQMEKILKINEV